jgi:hypothetical protein
MTEITRTIERLITLKSGVETLGESKWVVVLHPEGIAFRRFKTQGRSIILTWKELIGLGLTFKGRNHL